MSITRVLITTLCLALGAAAVASAVTVETVPVVPLPGPAALPLPPPRPAPAAPPPATAAALVARPTLSVPDFKGKLLSAARREGRKLGLVVSARHDSGLAVAADLARYYRVRRQLTAAGTTVDPGAAVELRVRQIEAPSGY